MAREIFRIDHNLTEQLSPAFITSMILVDGGSNPFGATVLELSKHSDFRFRRTRYELVARFEPTISPTLLNEFVARLTGATLS